jgi:hypothetical protein
MPYKHIAAHLKKTELACRLHYHQLSHGNHRRRRQSTSTNSSTSSSSSRYSFNQLPLPTYDAHTLASQAQASYNTYPSIQNSPGRVQHKLLLPKPPTITPDSSPDRLTVPRIDSLGIMQPQSSIMQHQSSVDPDRLHAIYNTHRGTFWSAIAADYGSDLSPTHLESVWRQTPNSFRRPPTPGDSPNSNTPQMLKPSVFPNYQTPPMQHNMAHTKDYSPMGHVMNHGYSTGSYESLPSLPRLDTRQTSWSNPNGVPATAITALLTEDKCPRHGDYCGGQCYGGH